ncbi:hypothetical protein E2C01_086146 [Portunus trituberculatus]|uniref:Uncharacterized protein n=1 Tax=Portunus trituberculatus TaxID=210409 RepID=A0A5B7J8H9_PORTR|nr:hypothetical protein [Portunus trituberculatus]
MYDDVVCQDRRRCQSTRGRISPGGRGRSQVTTQVHIDSLLIRPLQWKDTLTLPRLCDVQPNQEVCLQN